MPLLCDYMQYACLQVGVDGLDGREGLSFNLRLIARTPCTYIVLTYVL